MLLSLFVFYNRRVACLQWCPDCVNADPTIQATFGEKAPSEGRDAVSVMVGSREVYVEVTCLAITKSAEPILLISLFSALYSWKAPNNAVCAAMRRRMGFSRLKSGLIRSRQFRQSPYNITNIPTILRMEGVSTLSEASQIPIANKLVMYRAKRQQGSSKLIYWTKRRCRIFCKPNCDTSQYEREGVRLYSKTTSS